jgi:type I restriction enzyme M protein
LALYGQESNGSVWAICNMNLLLHGIKNADIKNGDTLTNPLHLDSDGELMRFDRVISNPPFSQRYSKKDLTFKERFRHGYTSQRAKRADLMFLQHMLAVLKPGGMMATVMPHGVLFRSRSEQDIRESILEDDLLEAVIGLPANLFYGASIPTTILVLRAKGAKPPERQGKVLFINADAEYRDARAQNLLMPEHIEKIVTTFREFKDMPRYARVVPIEELAENDYNLNIRRYADNAPPPEPHDVRAHLQGGVPLAEIETKRELFQAANLNPEAIFPQQKNHAGEYVAFHSDLAERGEIKTWVEADPGVQAQIERLQGTFEAWWADQSVHLVDLPGTKDLLDTRDRLMESFEAAMLPLEMLDRFQVTGAIAAWWDLVEFDMRTLANQGFEGLIDSWVASLRAAVEDEESRNGNDPMEHPLVEHLLPGYLAKLDHLASRDADLKAQIDEGKRLQEADDPDVDEDEIPSDDDLTEMRRERRRVRKERREMVDNFLNCLETARAEVGLEQAQELVLAIQRQRLESELDRYATEKRQALIEAIETWWDKYHVSLHELEAERDAAVAQLDEFVEELGYA